MGERLRRTRRAVAADDGPPPPPVKRERATGATRERAGLGALSGVHRGDAAFAPPAGDDGRRRMRFSLEPRHAAIIILLLVLALSVSMTMLVRQGTRLYALTVSDAVPVGTDPAIGTVPDDGPPVRQETDMGMGAQIGGSPAGGDAPVEEEGVPPTASPDVIDLNTATEAQLDTIPGVGPVTAGRIIAYRTSIGRYANVDQLLDVSGIGVKTLEKIRPYVGVTP